MEITKMSVCGFVSQSAFGIYCLWDATGDGVVDNFGSAMLFGKFSVPSIVFDPATIEVKPDVVEVVGAGVFSGYVDAGGAVRGVPCIVTASIGKDKTKFTFKRLSGEVLHAQPTGFPNSALSSINDLPIKDVLSSVG